MSFFFPGHETGDLKLLYQQQFLYLSLLTRGKLGKVDTACQVRSVESYLMNTCSLRSIYQSCNLPSRNIVNRKV